MCLSSIVSKCDILCAHSFLKPNTSIKILLTVANSASTESLSVTRGYSNTISCTTSFFYDFVFERLRPRLSSATHFSTVLIEIEVFQHFLLEVFRFFQHTTFVNKFPLLLNLPEMKIQPLRDN